VEVKVMVVHQDKTEMTEAHTVAVVPAVEINGGDQTPLVVMVPME